MFDPIMPIVGKRPSYFGVDILKHILAISVIIQHIHSNSRYSDATNNKIAQLVVLVQGAVLAFFLVSGYFFHIKREAGIVRTLSKNAQRYGKRLLIPFIIFSVINAIALVAIGKSSAHGVAKEILIGHGIGPQMYFLPFLFLAMLVGSVVQMVGSFSRRWEIGTLLALATVLVMTALRLPTAGATGDNYRLLPLYLLSFIVGQLIALAHERNGAAVALSIGGPALLFCALGLLDFRFYYVAAGVVAFAVAQYLSLILPSTRGPGSGGVYLLHTPIINFAISVALMKIGIVEWPNAILAVVCTYIVCLAFTKGFIKTMPSLRWMLLE